VNWTDGFAGVRASYVFSDKWSVVGYADAGAGDTKYSWQHTGALTTISRRPSLRNWVTGYSHRSTTNPISFIT
jgi:hypothetical protein